MSPEEYMRNQKNAPPTDAFVGKSFYEPIGSSLKTAPKLPNVAETLAERGGRYGKFIDHSQISQGMQDVMRAAPNWDKLDVDMRQALTTIADKIARILNGDPYYADSWHDISGYATLVERRLLED